MKRFLPLGLFFALGAAGCTSGRSPLPLAEGPPPAPLASSVFAGHARAFRFVKGAWIPAPEDDYDFTVLQNRFADRSEAVKEIHRRHPDYGGMAGPRDQTLWFAIRYAPAPDGGYDLAAETTLGDGSGHEEPGAAGLLLELDYAKKGWFVPFDTIRIRQAGTAGGRLRETIELFSKKDGREVPYMKLEEEGLVYRPAEP